MYITIAGLRAQGYSLEKIFGEFYWHPNWQIANAIGHNFWLWSILVLASTAMLARGESFQRNLKSGNLPSMALALSASALLHSFIDFLCHRDDAHMHFWPLTEWRFRSPVSYWDSAHYGTYFGMFEAFLGLLMVTVLIRRYKKPGIRLVLALAVIAYAAVPAFYFWSLGNH